MSADRVATAPDASCSVQLAEAGFQSVSSSIFDLSPIGKRAALLRQLKATTSMQASTMRQISGSRKMYNLVGGTIEFTHKRRET